ncbi:heterokaryon incompatibility protein-domain-containing protein [Xylaria cf. heliscus]|nr:heterokaryon incompatibility protein-domain-containing protein [Xylaria cf. heliscus]
MAMYHYEPLPPIEDVGKTASFTRLMCLSPGTSAQTLECTLSIIDVANSPSPYEALSYVWGTEKAQQPIKCYGYDIPITQNLRHALLALRHPTLKRLLWIDAVCINQQDTDERARQVAYMKLVYQYASRVIVWLGPENPIITRGLARAQELCEYRNMLLTTLRDNDGHMASPAQMNMQVDRTMLEALIAETGNTETGAQSIDDLIRLFHTTYFERVWCIQEVVASKECICKSGDVELDFYGLLSLLGLIVELGGPQKPYSPLRFWNQIYQQRNRQWDPHALKVEASVGSMLQVLMNIRNFQSTDPRDRLFAIFGISDEGLQPVLANMDAIVSGNNARLLSAMQRGFARLNRQADSLGIRRTERNPAMTPDYTKPVMEVYRDFTRFMIRKSPRVLDVLSHVQHTVDPSPAASWPSWVPRFDEPQLCSFFPHRLFLPGVPLNGHYPYFAELHDCPLRGIPKEPNVLQLDGFRVDEVASISDPVSSDYGGTLPVERLWNDLFAFPLFPRTKLEYVGGLEKLDTAFLLTLCGGGIGMILSMPDQLGELRDRLQALQILAEHARNQARHWLSSSCGFPESAYQDLMPRSGAVRNAHLNIAYYHVGVWNYIYHRRLFRTQRGYLGLGPDVMKPGDQVVALYGSHIALVLRQVSLTDWVLVGDCYLHHWDLMSGQLADLVRTGRVNIPTETFRLI